MSAAMDTSFHHKSTLARTRAGLWMTTPRSRPTYHAQERALERLKLPVSQLTAMLAAGAFVRVQPPSEKTQVEGRLLWSPLDKACVLVWQDGSEGAIVTCMLFAGSHLETKLLAVRGEDSVERLRAHARRKAVFWLVETGRPADTPGAAVAPVVAPAAPGPELHLHFPFGRRESLPFSLLPEAFVRAHPVRSQLTALRFIQALLDSPWGAELLADHVRGLGRDLNTLQDIAIQRTRVNGTMCPRVFPAKPALDCVLEDLEDGRALGPAMLGALPVDFTPMDPQYAFSAEDLLDSCAPVSPFDF